MEFLELMIKEYKSFPPHRPITSLYEGYGILKEEVDEFWDCVKKNNGDILEELVQIAAVSMAIADQLNYTKSSLIVQSDKEYIKTLETCLILLMNKIEYEGKIVEGGVQKGNKVIQLQLPIGTVGKIRAILR
jgi:hypothetical protein